jgi:hypothetical protein
VRAYWIAQGILLHLDMCDLAAAVLIWGQEWQALAAQTRNQLEPLAEEATRRYAEPLQRGIRQQARPGPPGIDDWEPERDRPRARRCIPDARRARHASLSLERMTLAEYASRKRRRTRRGVVPVGGVEVTLRLRLLGG